MKAVIAPPRVPSPSKNQRDFLFADMAKLADALDLGSSEATRAGSSPVIRIAEILIFQGFFFMRNKKES
jgi:hypothetical protein